jgi:hypothetical protein
MSMRRILVAALSPLVLMVAACGTAERTAGGAGTTPEQPPTTSAPAPEPSGLYEGNGMVLEAEDRGPQLCLGGVLESLPPQCSGVPLLGWDWGSVDGEERAAGTTWGSYHVVGRYDGETLTVTDVDAYQENSVSFGTDPDFSSPCPAPPGGWEALGEVTQEETDPVHAYARRQPDYVTSWHTHLRPAEAEFGPVVVNVVFTGEAERHEAEIGEFWDGPLCVVERAGHTARELARIRQDAEASLPALGLEMLWSTEAGVDGVIEIGVVVDIDGRGQAAFDARYGPGVIRVFPALKPAL